MRKTDKSKLLHELEIDGSSTADLPTLSDPATTATVIYFMAIVQIAVTSKPEPPSQLQTCIESHIKAAYKQCSTVALGPERYDFSMSIKGGERERRGSSKSQPESQIHSSIQKLPKINLQDQFC